MVQGYLVGLLVLANVIISLSVDPRSTEKTGALALLLANNLAALDAIADQVVDRGLAVAGLPAGH